MQELRRPVLDNESKLNFIELQKQWGRFTVELVRRLSTQPELRQALSQFADTPVSETLPAECIELLVATNTNPELADLLTNIRVDMGDVLTLPPVPAELIQPDIANAPAYFYPQDSIVYEGGRDGLTPAERKLVDLRYKMARYLKRLALGAELMEHPDISVDANHAATLPSGIKIQVNSEQAVAVNDLLNPMQWVLNKQIKDRVYSIQTRTGRYILKERKTSRHMHTKRHGHVDGLTSADEFSAAMHLEHLGLIEQAGVSVVWEKPIGYAEYPDGYSFAVFAFEPGLFPIDNHGIGTNAVIERYASLLDESGNHYVEEYGTVEQLALDIIADSNRFGLKVRWPRGMRGPVPVDDFFYAKAAASVETALELYRGRLIDAGYSNSDQDGYAFRMYRGNKQQPARLELVAMDLEYYTRSSTEYVQNKRAILETRAVRTALQSTREQPSAYCAAVMLAECFLRYPNTFESICKEYNTSIDLSDLRKSLK